MQDRILHEVQIMHRRKELSQFHHNAHLLYSAPNKHGKSILKNETILTVVINNIMQIEKCNAIKFIKNENSIFSLFLNLFQYFVFENVFEN